MAQRAAITEECWRHISTFAEYEVPPVLKGGWFARTIYVAIAINVTNWTCPTSLLDIEPLRSRVIALDRFV